MAVVIDPGAGALAQAIAGFGDSAAQAIFRKSIRERELQQNPELSISLGPAARAAVESGSVEQLATALGVHTDYISTLAEASPVTTAEQQERAGVERGLGEKRAATEDVTLGAQGSEARVRQGVADRFFELNGAELQARAQVAGAEYDANNAEFQSGLIDFQRENGVAEARLSAERTAAVLGEQAANAYGEILGQLEPGTLEYDMYVSALAAPSLTGALASLRNADLSAQIRLADAGQQSEEAKIQLTLELQTRFNEAVDRLAEAEDNGDSQFIDQAKQDVNNARLLIQTLQNRGKLTEGINLVAAEGRPGRVDFAPIEDLSERALTIVDTAQNLLTQQGPTADGGALGNVEDVRAQLEEALADPRLTARDKEQIRSEFARLVQAVEDASKVRTGVFSDVDPESLPNLQEQIRNNADFLSSTLGAGLTGTVAPR